MEVVTGELLAFVIRVYAAHTKVELDQRAQVDLLACSSCQLQIRKALRL